MPWRGVLFKGEYRLRPAAEEFVTWPGRQPAQDCMCVRHGEVFGGVFDEQSPEVHDLAAMCVNDLDRLPLFETDCYAGPSGE